MIALVLVVQFGVAGMLLLAGAMKLAVPRDVRATLAALGVARPEEVGLGVGALEIVAALGLAIAPHHPMVALMPMALGSVFAGAGALAIRRGARVTCACFGPVHRGLLGWHQVMLLPVWITTSWVLAVSDGGLNGRSGAVALLIAASALAMAVAVTLLSPARDARAYLAATDR